MYVFLEGLLACLSLLGRHTRGSFYRDGKRSILGMLTPGDFQGGQWGYEFQNEWSRCRRHTERLHSGLDHKICPKTFKFIDYLQIYRISTFINIKVLQGLFTKAHCQIGEPEDKFRGMVLDQQVLKRQKAQASQH